MPDMIDFLAGLQADGDTITLDGEPVCYVLGHTGRQVSTVEAAEWIVAAVHEYARFAEVIEAVKRVRGTYDAMMEKIQPPDERWQKLADEMQALQDIIYYRLPGDAEPKEAADAAR